MALSHIRALIFFLYTIENSPMDFSRESRAYFRIRTSVEVRNCTKSESFSKVHGPESLIFQIYVTFSNDFPNIYNNYCLTTEYRANFLGILVGVARYGPVFCSCSWLFARQLIHFSFYIVANEGDFSRPVPTRFSPLLFMFLLILFLAKYDKIM